MHPLTSDQTETPSGGGLPRRFGDYELLEKLGQGGMGVVYRARQIKANRLVAIKMVLAGAHAGEAERARFRTEVEAIAHLQHPGIVQIYDVGDQGGVPYFSLEFCVGGSLARKLAGTPLPPREAAAVVEKLAWAMHAAHQKGVLHRDLKPANVLLGEDGTPKVTDFGLAKKLDEVGPTVTGVVMGTPSYMSPEQAGGKRKEIGPACDVYALGAILYECLTGRPPFRAATALDTLRQVECEDPVPPRALNPTVPRDLETVCLRCLQKEPARRYTSAAGLAEDLRRFQAGEPVNARPLGILGRAAKWVRRNRIVALLLAAVFVALVAGTVVSAWFAVDAARQAKQARENADEVLAAFQREEQLRKERAVAQVDVLMNEANLEKALSIIKGLDPYREVILARLEEVMNRGDLTGAQRLRIGLALLPKLPKDPRHSRKFVEGLIGAEPEAWVLVRNFTEPRRSDVTSMLWEAVGDAKVKAEPCLRLFCTLAVFDQNQAHWEDVKDSVVDQLLSAAPEQQAFAIDALRPVRRILLSPLPSAGQAESSARRQVSAVIMAAYATDDRPEILAELIMGGDERQYAIGYRALKAHMKGVVALLRAELAKGVGNDASDNDKDRLARRQSQAAVALLQLGEGPRVWPLLKHREDCRLRTYLIHRLTRLGTGREVLSRRLGEEMDASARSALILSLGNLKSDPSLVTELLKLYQDDPDPGVHSAVGWLLASWGFAKDLRQIERKVASGGDRPGYRWYINRQGQMLAIIPGSAASTGGASEEKQGPDKSELSDRRKRLRSFAIATTEVTVEQFERFLSLTPKIALTRQPAVNRDPSPPGSLLRSAGFRVARTYK
jgi:tRNA A-37 threonylcarbamoyl transferase component Bud32